MKLNINNEGKLKEYIKNEGLRLTDQRKRIINYFCGQNRHYTAEKLYSELKKRIPYIGFATVYRTLHLLVNAGLARKTRFRDNITRFEPFGKKKHHDHMICLGCGTIIEFDNQEIEKLQKKVAKKYHFFIESHKLELYGYCKECRQKFRMRGNQ